MLIWQKSSKKFIFFYPFSTQTVSVDEIIPPLSSIFYGKSEDNTDALFVKNGFLMLLRGFPPLFTQNEKSFRISVAADARQCMPPNPARTGM